MDKNSADCSLPSLSNRIWRYVPFDILKQETSSTSYETLHVRCSFGMYYLHSVHFYANWSIYFESPLCWAPESFALFRSHPRELIQGRLATAEERSFLMDFCLGTYTCYLHMSVPWLDHARSIPLPYPLIPDMVVWLFNSSPVPALRWFEHVGSHRKAKG